MDVCVAREIRERLSNALEDYPRSPDHLSTGYLEVCLPWRHGSLARRTEAVASVLAELRSAGEVECVRIEARDHEVQRYWRITPAGIAALESAKEAP